MDQSVSPYLFRKDTRHYDAMDESASPWVWHMYLFWKKDTRHCDAMDWNVSLSSAYDRR